MNSRITDLKKQATEVTHGVAPHAGGITTFHLNPELFAELILKECIEVIDPSNAQVSMSEEVWRKRCMELIRKHFGV